MSLRKNIGFPIVTYADNGVELSPLQSKKVVSEFLKFQRSKKIKVWEEGSTHFGWITNQAGVRKVKITFPRKVVYRSKRIVTTHKKYARYDIVGNKIGSGHFGDVFDVLATLSHLQNGSMKVKTDQEYVIKIQDHTKRDAQGELQNEPEIAANEEHIGHSIPHLGTKRITYRKNKQGKIVESYLVSRKLKDKTLLDVIINDYKQQPTLKIHERFKLSIAILRAYIEQLTDRRIAHRDIKSENVMSEGNEWLKYFDMGVAKKIDVLDDSYAGSPRFSAPEVLSYKAIQDQKSDFYSLGIILFDLWRAQEDYEVNEAVLRQLAEAGQSRKFARLGLGISEINELLPKINNLLEGLIAFEKDDRTHPLKAIEKFENLFLEYKLQNKDSSVKSIIREGNFLAREANHQLRDIKLEKVNNPLIALQKVIDRAVLSLKSIKCDDEKLNKKQVEQIAVMEFVDTVNVRAFKSIIQSEQFTVDDIAVKARKIITDFVKNTNLVFKMHDQLKHYVQLLNVAESDKEIMNTRLVLDELFEKIDVLSYKIKMNEISFDDLETLNEKCKKKFPAVQEFIIGFEKKIKEQNKYELQDTYNQLFLALNLIPNDSVGNLRNEIKKVMTECLEDVLISGNIKAAKKMVNVESYSGIKGIISALNSPFDDSHLKNKVIENLNKMNTGFFPSKLEKNLRHVVMSPKRFSNR